MTFLLLQAANLALAVATAWIRFRDPHLWDDQAIVYSTVSGALLASLTALLLGIAMYLAEESRWKSHAIHLLLTLGFVGLQGWLLWKTGQELGVIHILQWRLEP